MARLPLRPAPRSPVPAPLTAQSEPESRPTRSRSRPRAAPPLNRPPPPLSPPNPNPRARLSPAPPQPGPAPAWPRPTIRDARCAPHAQPVIRQRRVGVAIRVPGSPQPWLRRPPVPPRWSARPRRTTTTAAGCGARRAAPCTAWRAPGSGWSGGRSSSCCRTWPTSASPHLQATRPSARSTWGWCRWTRRGARCPRGCAAACWWRCTRSCPTCWTRRCSTWSRSCRPTATAPARLPAPRGAGQEPGAGCTGRWRPCRSRRGGRCCGRCWCSGRAWAASTGCTSPGSTSTAPSTTWPSGSRASPTSASTARRQRTCGPGRATGCWAWSPCCTWRCPWGCSCTASGRGSAPSASGSCTAGCLAAGASRRRKPCPGTRCAPCAWRSAGTRQPRPAATCSAGSASPSGATPRRSVPCAGRGSLPRSWSTCGTSGDRTDRQSHRSRCGAPGTALTDVETRAPAHTLSSRCLSRLRISSDCGGKGRHRAWT